MTQTDATPRKRPLLRRVLNATVTLAAIGAIVAVSVTAISFLNRRAAVAEVGPAIAAVPVTTMTIQIEPGYTVRDLFAGRVEAERQTALAFDQQGVIEAILVDEGEAIEAGQPLARLDTRLIAADLDRLAAESDRIASELTLARRTAERQQSLQRDGHASSQRLDEAVTAVNSLEAQAQSVAAERQRLAVLLDKAVLKAPFSGRVAARTLDDGATVTPGVPVMTVLETGALRARIGIPPEIATTALALGEQVDIEVGGRQLPAVLANLRPDVAARTRTVEALFTLLPATPEELSAAPAGQDIAMAGEIARLALDRTVPSPGAWVPLTALKEGLRGLWTVLAIAEEDGRQRAVLESVEVLHVAGDRAFVRGTVRDGMQIVASGINRLVPGQPVDPVNHPDTPDAAETLADPAVVSRRD